MFPSLVFRVFYDGTSLMGIGSRDVGDTPPLVVPELPPGGWVYLQLKMDGGKNNHACSPQQPFPGP
jgi:hypothetical protein